MNFTTHRFFDYEEESGALCPVCGHHAVTPTCTPGLSAICRHCGYEWHEQKGD